MVTSRVVKTEVEGLLDYLLASEIALYTNGVRDDVGVVSWYSYRADAIFLPSRRAASPLDYRHWVEEGQYSAVLYDGSLIQITYEVGDSELVGHRLAYVPAPFSMAPSMLQEYALVDVFDLHASGSTADVVMQATLRFDYDPANARNGHPASHMTFNAVGCRIACIAPLRLGQFADFIFRHFYPHVWALHPYFEQLPHRGWGERTASRDERDRPHLSWTI